MEALIIYSLVYQDDTKSPIMLAKCTYHKEDSLNEHIIKSALGMVENNIANQLNEPKNIDANIKIVHIPSDKFIQPQLVRHAFMIDDDGKIRDWI